MIKLKSICFFCFFTQFVLAQGELNPLESLPDQFEEISGMSYDAEKQIVWAINDSGNDAVVYGYDLTKKQITSELYLEDAHNNDWEDLALGTDGVLYVSDTGNNRYKRKHFTIYWVEHLPTTGKHEVSWLATKIKFPEEHTKKDKIQYDIEALIHHDGNFYLFTKTKRKKGFPGWTRVFKVSAVPGTVHASQVAQIELNTKDKDYKITGAAINKQQTVALVSHKSIWTFNPFKEGEFKVDTLKQYKLQKDSQKEAITFKTIKLLLLSDEANKGDNYLYQLNLSEVIEQ